MFKHALYVYICICPKEVEKMMSDPEFRREMEKMKDNPVYKNAMEGAKVL
jgi:hypothetical protein